MHIGIVGGLERAAPFLRKMASSNHHTVEFHRGDVGGRGGHSLEAVIARSELVVVITEVNSHGSVLGSRKLAKELGVRLLIVRKLSSGRFLRILATLDQSAAPRAASK